jgi:fucose 4-O-acetylase-like acetyltransferase
MNEVVGASRTKRVDYYDIAKGIGILMVMLGHSGNLCKPLHILAVIAWTFHMPLFFILSGLCFKRKEHGCLSSLFKRLVMPYLFTILLFVLYYLVLGNFKESLEWLIGGGYGSGYQYDTPFFIKGIGGIWFFLALFWARLILNEISRLPEYLVIVLSIAFAYWGVYSYNKFVLPCEIQNGCIGLLFLYIGFLAKKYNLFRTTNWPLLVISLIVWGAAYRGGYAILLMVNCKVEVISVITSCFACYVVISFSKILDNDKVNVIKRVLSWIGRSTAIILSFHIFELHTGISENIANACFHTSNGDVILAIRCVWCLMWAYIVPKLPYIRKVFNV